jgi:hypothetical protein
MKFSELTDADKKDFIGAIITIFSKGAAQLGWLLKSIDQEGIATFELRERDSFVCQVNLSNLLKDIILLDRDKPELGEAELSLFHISSVLNVRLAILEAMKEGDMAKQTQALREIGKKFKGRLRVWKAEGDLNIEEITETREPVLWVENGEEVQ